MELSKKITVITRKGTDREVSPILSCLRRVLISQRRHLGAMGKGGRGEVAKCLDAFNMEFS